MIKITPSRQLLSIALFASMGVFLFVGVTLTGGMIIIKNSIDSSKLTAALTGSTTLTIVTNVVNNHGGTKVAENFTQHVRFNYETCLDYPLCKQTAYDSINAPQDQSSATGTTYTFTPPLTMRPGSGYFNVSQDKDSSYIEIYGSDCAGFGGGNIAPGEQKTCTITNYDVNTSAMCGYYSFDEQTSPGFVTFSDDATGSGYFLVPDASIRYPSTTDSMHGLARSAVGATFNGVGVGNFHGGIPPKFSHLQSGNTVFGWWRMLERPTNSSQANNWLTVISTGPDWSIYGHGDGYPDGKHFTMSFYIANKSFTFSNLDQTKWHFIVMSVDPETKILSVSIDNEAPQIETLTSELETFNPITTNNSLSLITAFTVSSAFGGSDYKYVAAADEWGFAPKLVQSQIDKLYANGAGVDFNTFKTIVRECFPQTTLTVVKKVINDSKTGEAKASDFKLHIKQNGLGIPGSPWYPNQNIIDTTTTSTASLTENILPGNYVVSEDPNSLYETTFSGSCDSQGNVSLASGEEKTCTITNNDVLITLPSPPPSAITPCSNAITKCCTIVKKGIYEVTQDIKTKDIPVDATPRACNTMGVNPVECGATNPEGVGYCEKLPGEARGWCKRTCITIKADEVVLNLKTKQIVGDLRDPRVVNKSGANLFQNAIRVEGKKATIKNGLIGEFATGVWLLNSSQNILDNLDIIGVFYGINDEYKSNEANFDINNVISKNWFVGVSYPIQINSNKNKIQSNQFNNAGNAGNARGGWLPNGTGGINLSNSSGNTISKNTIFLPELGAGIVISAGSENIIEKNKIIGDKASKQHSAYGVSITGLYLGNNNASQSIKNVISENEFDYVLYGVSLNKGAIQNADIADFLSGAKIIKLQDTIIKNNNIKADESAIHDDAGFVSTQSGLRVPVAREKNYLLFENAKGKVEWTQTEKLLNTTVPSPLNPTNTTLIIDNKNTLMVKDEFLQFDKTKSTKVFADQNSAGWGSPESMFGETVGATAITGPARITLIGIKGLTDAASTMYYRNDFLGHRTACGPSICTPQPLLSNYKKGLVVFDVNLKGEYSAGPIGGSCCYCAWQEVPECHAIKDNAVVNKNKRCDDHISKNGTTDCKWTGTKCISRFQQFCQDYFKKDKCLLTEESSGSYATYDLIGKKAENFIVTNKCTDPKIYFSGHGGIYEDVSDKITLFGAAAKKCVECSGTTCQKITFIRNSCHLFTNKVQTQKIAEEVQKELIKFNPLGTVTLTGQQLAGGPDDSISTMTIVITKNSITYQYPACPVPDRTKMCRDWQENDRYYCMDPFGQYDSVRCCLDTIYVDPNDPRGSFAEHKWMFPSAPGLFCPLPNMRTIDWK